MNKEPVYVFQVTIPQEIRTLYTRMNQKERAEVKKDVRQLFEMEIAECAELGDKYVPMEHT